MVDARPRSPDPLFSREIDHGRTLQPWPSLTLSLLDGKNSANSDQNTGIRAWHYPRRGQVEGQGSATGVRLGHGWSVTHG